MTDRKETPTEFVAKVSVKLPDFWTEDPDLWFVHAEAAFRNTQITQSITKFDHIVQKLPQKIMVSVRGLIMGSVASSELTRGNPDRNIFSINVELTSTFLLYRGLVHQHH